MAKAVLVHGQCSASLTAYFANLVFFINFFACLFLFFVQVILLLLLLVLLLLLLRLLRREVQDLVFCSSQTSSTPSIHPYGSLEPSLGQSWPHVTPMLAYVAPILALSWPHVGPGWP